IKKKFTVLVSGIGCSSREDLLYSGPGYTSSLIIYRNLETYLIWQQILEDQCSLRVFKGKNEINKYVGKTPTIVWNKYGMCQNQDHLALL
ncbi:7218_t:CDS:1, partial [Cetraspora pellucida]